MYRTVAATARYCNFQEKYSSILTESLNISETRRKYLKLCRDKNMPHMEKFKVIYYSFQGTCMHLLAWGTTKISKMMSLEVFFQKWTEILHTPAYQRRIEHVLEFLTIDERHEGELAIAKSLRIGLPKWFYLNILWHTRTLEKTNNYRIKKRNFWRALLKPF